MVSFLGGDLDASKLLGNRFASDNQLPFWAFSFGLGMTGAWAYVRLRDRVDAQRLRRLAGRCQVAALIALAFFVYLAGHYATIGAPPFTATLAQQTLLIGIGLPASTAAFMLSQPRSRPSAASFRSAPRCPAGSATSATASTSATS